MTTESDDVVNSKRVLVFLYLILFFGYAMWISQTHIVYCKYNIEYKKIKTRWEFYIVALSCHRCGGNFS